MKTTELFWKVRQQIDADLPIAISDLVKAGFASRPTLWRMERGGLKVTRIGRKIYVRFSDLVAFRGSTGSGPVVGKDSGTDAGASVGRML